MKHLFLSIAILALFSSGVAAQIVTQMPVTFDIVKENIPHGKIDTVSYNSKTVGTSRRALIYTPPGYSKKKNTLSCIYFMGLGEMKKNG